MVITMFILDDSFTPANNKMVQKKTIIPASGDADTNTGGKCNGISYSHHGGGAPTALQNSTK